jgi:hypothetical protein
VAEAELVLVVVVAVVQSSQPVTVYCPLRTVVQIELIVV